MGCANVSQLKLVQSKDIDLNLDITKLHFKETNETSNFQNKVEGIFDEKITIVKNDIEFITNNKKEKIEEKVMNAQQRKDSIGSGPIIRMLKRQANNHKKMKKI